MPTDTVRSMLVDRVREAKQGVADLVKLMGVRFMWLLSLLTHVDKGFVFGGGTEGLVGTPIQFLFRQYGTLTASRIQILKTIAGSPWALKPLFGMVSDTITLGGYNKLPYIVVTTLAACMACTVIAFVAPLSPTALTLLIFVLFTQCAVSDLLVEAKYTQKIKGHDELGPVLTSFNQTGMAVAGFVTILACGLLITYAPLTYIYLIPLPVFLVILYTVDDNWLDDEEYSHRDRPDGAQETLMEATGGLVRRQTVRHRRLTNLLGVFCLYRQADDDDEDEDERPVPIVGFDRGKVTSHWRLFLLSGLIAGFSLTTSTIGLLGLPSLWLFIISILCVVAMIIALFVLLEDRRTAMIQTFVVLQSVCNVSTGSADFFFFTDSAVQYPEGPHFSTFFYVTVMGLVAASLHLVGVLIYYVFMSHWRFRSVLYFSNVMLILFSVPGIVLVNRWNLVIGLPDWLFVLGTETLQVVTGAWASMPINLMMFQLSPLGVEATSFAMLAGSSNMGRAVAQYIGAYLLEVFDVRPTGAPGESHQFANLWKVYLIGIFLSLVPLVMIRFLIPDRSQKSSLLESDEPVETMQ